MSFILSSLGTVDGDVVMFALGIVESGPMLWGVESLFIIVSSDQLQIFLNELFNGCMKAIFQSGRDGIGIYREVMNELSTRNLD